MRAAIPDQIEFDIAPAAIQLPVAFAFAVRHVFAAFDNRQIGVEKMVADAALQGEAPRETADMPVVEEQATDATRFISMLEEEIVVAPFLQRRIDRKSTRLNSSH